MMKLNNIIKYIGIAGIAALSIWSAACSGVTSPHEKFVEEGEVIYRGKVDSLQVFAGKNRLRVSWLLPTDAQVSTSTIYWNERSDSLVVDVKEESNGDTLIVDLVDLEEGSYVLEVVGFDDAGNSSLPVTASGRVYGSKYEGGLLNRLVQETGFTTESETFLEWSSVSEQVISTEFIYTDEMGASQTLFVPASENTTLLDNYQLHSTYKYRTLYLPEPTAIDTFYTAWDEAEVAGKPAPVFADTTYTIIARHSGKAIAVADSSIDNGGNVIQDGYNAAAPEEWDISAETVDGYFQYYVIANRYSGKAMAVSGASENDGANVLQWDLGSGGNDLWTFTWLEGDYYKIVNLNSGKVLEVAENDMGDGANVQQNEWDGGENQQFKIEAVATPAAPFPAPVNLALGATVTDESSACSCGPVEDLFDGKMDTYWQPLSSDRNDFHLWVEFDLGSSQTFNQLDQYWRSGEEQVEEYRISYSDDGITWYLAYMEETDGFDEDGEFATFPSAVTARYVRLDIYRDDDNGLTVREIEVYNLP